MREFDLIGYVHEVFRQAGAADGAGCPVGIGDDAAVLDVPASQQLVACTDALVEGVHFPEATPAAAVGYKALAVNLSDLAAMGAEPAWFLMALALPQADTAWVDAFATGMAELAVEADIRLVGGDVTSGRRSVCITAMGLVEPGTALRRDGAQPGDRVVVSGQPGRAANALRALESGDRPDAGDKLALQFPEPRLALGRALRGRATACIDLSDGLLSDLGHVLQRSGCGAVVELERIPCAETLLALPAQERWRRQLTGGDDYELCFTLPAAECGHLAALGEAAGIPLTVVGEITEAPGLTLLEPGGQRYQPQGTGWEHFR